MVTIKMLSFQEKGRLSQSETEEEEEIPVKKKVKDKKKGSSLKEEGKKKKKQKNEPQTTPSHPYPNLPVPQEVLDMPVDPNEPTYCLCGQVSYGEMIGCDNPDCPIEWFHVSRILSSADYCLLTLSTHFSSPACRSPPNRRGSGTVQSVLLPSRRSDSGHTQPVFTQVVECQL